jgi:hypothetical protein
MLIDEYLKIIVMFLLPLFIAYLLAYSKEKGKNKALQEDIYKLEEEKQKIILKNNSEIERLKKEHTLDIEKRKFKYEDKRIQFTKFFLMIDEFQRKSTNIMLERFSNILSEFFSSSITGNENQKKQAIYKFTHDIQPILSEIDEERIKMFNETSSIRLISSPEIDILLTEFENALENSKEIGSKMINFMATPEYILNPEILTSYTDENEKSGNRVLECREKLKNRMKYELNEI